MDGEQALVKLYYEARAEADEASFAANAEGLRAEVGRIARGTMWTVTLSGDPQEVSAFAQRLQSKRSP